MDIREKTFVIRLTLEAAAGETVEDDDGDEEAWAAEWEAHIKPGLIREVFAHLRSFADWHARIRNRGISPLDEVEIVVTRARAPRA